MAVLHGQKYGQSQKGFLWLAAGIFWVVKLQERCGNEFPHKLANIKSFWESDELLQDGTIPERDLWELIREAEADWDGAEQPESSFEI